MPRRYEMDPYGVVGEGGRGVCQICFFRFPGVLGHGPPCQGHKKDDKDKKESK